MGKPELIILVSVVLQISSYTNALEVAEVEEAVYYSNRAACEYTATSQLPPGHDSGNLRLNSV